MHCPKRQATLWTRGTCVAMVQKVPADALGDARRGRLHGIAGQVSVPRRGLNQGVAQELADHSQALAERQCTRGRGVA